MIEWNRVAELREEIGAEDFAEVVDLFLEEVEARLVELPEAPDDPAILAEICHFLKGSALNLGFRDFATLCHEGERAANEERLGDVQRDAIVRTFYASRDVFTEEMDQRLVA